MKTDSFYAKILLFGEYSVIFDSMALTIPYTHFGGELSFLDEYKYTDIDFARESNRKLNEFHSFLIDNKELISLFSDQGLNRLNNDIKKGLYFESTIPQGFGVGSSGALCAAVYSKYAKDKIRPGKKISAESIRKLKNIFSKMESYFHGKSSGLDPLNSYLRNPLLINGKSDISQVKLSKFENSEDPAIFLLNTKMPRHTGGLMEKFMARCSDPAYNNKIRNIYIPLNNNCILSMIRGDLKTMAYNLEMLSKFQFDNFEPMIPESIRPMWQKGLRTKDYFIKLCGSGGGGFMLGFTPDFDNTFGRLSESGFELIPVYKKPSQSDKA